MSKLEHTPGPWEAITPCPGQCCWNIQPVGNDQAEFGFINQPEMGEADAKLCAAAPDLLDVVQALIVISESGLQADIALDENSPLMDAARDAIKKATEPH